MARRGVENIGVSSNRYPVALIPEGRGRCVGLCSYFLTLGGFVRTPESFFPGERFGAVKTVTPVSGGLSGAGVYAVTTEAGEFFLRLSVAGREGFDEMLAAQRLAAKEGIAPKVIFVDEAVGAVITEKASGIPIAAVLAQPEIRPLALRKVAEALARLHAIPAPGLPPSDPSLGKSIWDQQSWRDGFPEWAKPLGSCIGLGDAALAKDQRRVFSHNDVNPANLIWDGSQVWMVDWERAALAHPYMDLATFSAFTILPDEDAIALLSVQECSSIDAEQRHTFLALRNYVRAIYGAVFFRLIPDLTAVEFVPRHTTPTLSECYGLLGKGLLDLRVPAGQALLGAAILRQVQ
jgi:aminoglycoside phosphotransferase (APT) family kinase protein